MDIYISMGHVASGVHHCSVEYIYRESGGGKLRPRTNWPICPPMPTLPPGGPRRRHVPLQCGPLSTGQSPSAHQQAPGPLAGAMSPHPGTGGLRTACSAWWRGGLPRGSPCQGPHRKIRRRPGTHITQRSYSHPSAIPQPQTVGPRSLLHRLTDPIRGVKVQNAVKVARNCCGGRFLYGGGPCTTKTPYKVGHLFEKLSDISDFRGT